MASIRPWRSEKPIRKPRNQRIGARNCRTMSLILSVIEA
jgi:hypothetical protein